MIHYCKLCNNFDSGFCLVFGGSRTPGHRRFCTHYDEKKIVKKSMKVTRVPWMSRNDKKKEILRRKAEVIKLLDKAKLVEQQQALTNQEKPILVTHAEPTIEKKGQGFFKKIFNRGGEK